MSKRLKIIISAFSFAFLIFLLIAILKTLENITGYSNLRAHLSDEQWKNTFLPEKKEDIFYCFILIFSFLFISIFNFLMWFKNLFGIPLTPEQAAERKRIKQERRKARLQEKLSKLN